MQTSDRRPQSANLDSFNGKLLVRQSCTSLRCWGACCAGKSRETHVKLACFRFTVSLESRSEWGVFISATACKNDNKMRVCDLISDCIGSIYTTKKRIYMELEAKKKNSNQPITPFSMQKNTSRREREREKQAPTYTSAIPTIEFAHPF